MRSAEIYLYALAPDARHFRFSEYPPALRAYLLYPVDASIRCYSATESLGAIVKHDEYLWAGKCDCFVSFDELRLCSTDVMHPNASFDNSL